LRAPGGGGSPLGVILFITLALMGPARAFYLQGTDMSYARYPKWNACINASIGFDFRTTQKEGLLLYTDDGGRYDFFEIMHRNGRVTAVLNIVDGRDGHIQIDVGSNVNDGKWHRVKLQRNRMETTLMVDGVTARKFSFGSDFHFGTPENNSHVYLGGMPAELRRDLHALALPSVLFQARFKGSMRNILYSNCTCNTVRARMLDGAGVQTEPREACDVRNPCRDGCMCVSTDTSTDCDCTDLQCVTGRYRTQRHAVHRNIVQIQYITSTSYNKHSI
jgi:neurexin